MSTITLSAQADYGHQGQYIARLIGRAPNVQFKRDFVGTKYGKRNECTSYETDEPGIYELNNETRKGRDRGYILVVEWKDELRKLSSDKEDALAICKRLDAGEQFGELVALELEPMTKSKYVQHCAYCDAELEEGQHCTACAEDHPDHATRSQAVQVPDLKEDGTQKQRLVYSIRKPGEAKKAAAAATLDAAVAAIVAALGALPAAEQKRALKVAKDQLFAGETKCADSTAA